MPNVPAELRDRVVLGVEWVVSKKHDRFFDVVFKYETEDWVGALPLHIGAHSKSYGFLESYETLSEVYNLLAPDQRAAWIARSDTYWESVKGTKTYDVLKALYTTRWECRVCGPVPKANAQPAARIRDLIKLHGYTIASKSRLCGQCQKKTTHDLLVMIERVDVTQNPFVRSAISSALRDRILTVLQFQEAVFNTRRSSRELVIDHKFPSQRWSAVETVNSDDMTDDEIRSKFQLLSNQTNMLKSRSCDACVTTGQRQSFLGIEWFYEGAKQWEGNDEDPERGCKGCPWYDITKWKMRLIEALKNDLL